MFQSAHISRTSDNSLRHRVAEYLAALEAHNNLQHSKKYMNDPQWSDTLGHEEDIMQAEQILNSSLLHSTSRISKQDVETAIQQGLLSQSQAQEFSKTKLQMEFELQSSKSKNTQSNSSGQTL